MIRYLRERGADEVVGRIHIEDKLKLKLADDLGFERKTLPGVDVAEVRLTLN